MDASRIFLIPVFEMKNSLATINDKNHLLRSIAGNGVEQLASVMQQWEKFEMMFDSHQLMIKEQVWFRD